MIILDARLVNQQQFLLMLEKKSKAVKEAVSTGIERAVDLMKEDLEEHAPKGKTLRAQSSVYGEMRSALDGRVGFDRKKAFYMQMVEVTGAKPHLIIAKARQGGRSSKRLQKYYNKHAMAFSSQGQTAIDFVKANLGADAYQFRPAALRAYAKGRLSGALALSFGGRLFTKVQHPGLRAQRIIPARAAANRDRITATVWGGVQDKVIKS